jgi:anti-anti-sigma factor
VTRRDPPTRQATFSATADVASATVHARGELNRHTVDLLWDTINLLLRAGQQHVWVDLAKVSSIDTAGVKLLVALQHSLSSHGRDLIIINTFGPVHDALQRGQLSGLASHDDDGG